MVSNNNETLNGQESVENQNHKAGEFKHEDYFDDYIEQSIKGDLGYFKDKKNVVEDFYQHLKLIGKENIINDFKDKFKDKEIIKTLLQKQINFKVLPIYDLISKLESTCFKDLNLNNKQKDSLSKSFLSKDEKVLYGLIKSEKQRHNYLLKEGILKKDELEEKLNGISKSDEQVLNKIFGNSAQFIDTLKQDEELLYSIFSVYNLNSTVHYTDIKTILESSIFKNRKDEKAALVKYFLPTISLENAKKVGLFSDQDIENELSSIAQDNNLTGDDVADFIDKADRKRIFIDTDSLDFSNIEFDNNSDDILKSIADEINESKIDRVDILGIDQFKNACKKANLSIDLDKFKEGNYINITSKDDSGKETSFYFYIKNISTTGVELVNVTKLNGISATNEGKKDFHTFAEMFNLLETTSKSQSKKIFISEKSDLKVGEEKIKEIPEKNDVKDLESLKLALDEIDPKGAGIPIEKMAFTFRKGEKDTTIFDENLYFISKIDKVNNSIKLDNGQVFVGADLANFVRAFEENKCSRFKKIDTAGEFLENMSLTNDNFKDLIFDDGKIISKDQKGHHDLHGINLFIGKDQDKDGTIQIDEIKDGMISFSFGKYIEGNKDKKEPNTFKSDKSAKNWSYTEFFMFVKNKKLTPKQEDVKEHHDENHHGEHLHRHRSLFTGYMGWWSITEIVKGAHQMIHTIEHSLETGNKLKAAKAALAFGKFLPLHLRVELQSEVESSEKETMEKIKKELLGVDSSDMFPMILHILENKSAPQYEIEAAMFATLKYGSLYPKSLAKYRGSYAWFEALGGTKSMIASLTEESLKNDPDLVVTEEVLINSLLALQAKGYAPPKRRSKIHKEFGKTIQEGLSSENGDGEREAGLRMTADGRIKYLMDEFKGATYAHGIGGMEKVWDKGPDPAWKMNTLPFVIMSTGITMDMHQSLINKVKNYAFTTPYGSLLLASSKEGVDMYDKYLEKVIELYAGAGSPMYKDFKSIKKPAKGTKVEAAYDFWRKYGEKLYPVINMNDGFVVSKKDDEGNEALKYYYSKMNRLYNSDDFSVKRDNITGGHYDVSNSPIVQTGALIEDHIIPKDRGYLDDVGKKVLNSSMDYIIGVVNNSKVGEKEKKEIFKKAYKQLERHIYLKMVAYKPKDDKEKDKKDKGEEKWYGGYEIYMEMRKKGFDVFDDKVSNPDDEDEVKKFSERQGGYDEFLENEWLKFKNKNHLQNIDDVSQEKVHVQYSIDDILDSHPANDNMYKNAA